MTARALPFLLALLVGASAVFGARLVARTAPSVHADWAVGGGAAARARAAELAAELGDPLRITYWTSAPDDLPATHTALPTAVHERLRDLFSDADDATVSRAFPGAHPEWSSFLSAAGVRPTRARTVRGDGWTEARLWSSLRVECGPAPAAVWNGVGPDDLPLLDAWVLGRLEQRARPRAARIGVDAPPDYGVLRARLADLGEVREVDAATDDLGALDLLVWVAPDAVDAATLARLDAFRASGGSLAIAASAWTARESRDDDAARLELAASGFPAGDVLAHYGLVADPLPVFDERWVGDDGTDEVARPHRVRCIAPNQDFRELADQPNGDVPFVAPTAFRLDPEALAARGLRGVVIASAGADAWSPPVADGARSQVEWNAMPRRENAYAPLAALLLPEDPWEGDVVYLGSASPLSDEALAARDAAPTRMLAAIADTLASDERLVRRGLASRRPAPLPELAPTERLAWRGLVVGLVPLALVIATVLARRGRARTKRAWRPLVPVGAAAIALAFLVPRLAAGGASFGGATAPERAQRVFADLAPADGTTRFATLFSFDSDLPPEWRGAARDAEHWCRALADAVPGLAYDGMRSAREGAAPAEVDVTPLSVSSTLDERTTVRRVYAHLIVFGGDGTRAIPLESAEAIGDLPFRLALALTAARDGRAPTLAVLANAPRLSPAEAELEYARRGLHPPRGGEAFGAALDGLRAAGFALETIDRDAPRVSDDADAALWLQPRRDTLPMSVALADHLASGGRAIVAGQHFRVLARQRDDADGALRFWPQPQFCDLDSGYLPALGATLAREVLFDELYSALDVPTQVQTEDGDRVVRQPAAGPFLLRVPAANRAPGFAGAADLSMPGGARWVLDDAQLARRGIAAEVLATTSTGAWAFDWRGGDLPEGALGGARGAADVTHFDARQPLAVALEGRFPTAEVAIERTPDGRERGRLVVADDADGAAPDGRLVLLGGSLGFTDELVRAGGARGDRALLAMVADLACAPEVAALLPRDDAARGFDHVPPRERTAWRVAVVGLVPALLLLLAWIGRARA